MEDGARCSSEQLEGGGGFVEEGRESDIVLLVYLPAKSSCKYSGGVM